MLLELPLGEAAETFDLEKAVCSHGLFMMPPNHWDRLSKSLIRPLRLHPHDDDYALDDPSDSVIVRISQPIPLANHQPHLLLRVFGTRSLSLAHQQALLSQARRMLRLSENDEMAVRGFQKMGLSGRGGGRIFRSPTLFEDMVKCILLCNCQWARTLSMARALCELQLELQHHSSHPCPLFSEATTSKAQSEDFTPKTPNGKDLNKQKKRKGSISSSKTELVADANLSMDHTQTMTQNINRSSPQPRLEIGSCQNCKICQAKEEIYKDDPCLRFDFQYMGNFPSPRELSNLDESFLAKRGNLGYRASRILKLAKSIVEGRLQLKQLEEFSEGYCLSSYNLLAEQLKAIDGFGPFTCANVLMCMGFYHVIPTDSETIRHLKQVHAKKSTIQTVQRDVEVIYGKYEPFQFLAYWSELWKYYEKRFGKMSEMAYSDYKLITASNMRSNGRGNSKIKKL